jgi:hypothetical protein
MRYLSSFIFTPGLLALAASLCLTAAPAHAGPISTVDPTVVVLRVGDGATAFSNAAAVFLEEYAIGFNGAGIPTTATHVQTIPVPMAPVTGTPPGTKLAIGGTASLEGGLNFSADGQYLMFTGNDAVVGETNSGKRKIVGRLDLAGNVTLDAIYGPGTTASGNAIRTVTSLDGNQYWFGEGGGAAGTPGIAYRPWQGPNTPTPPGTDSVTLSTQNTRRLEIYNGQLYVGTGAGSIFGVATVGSGTPTSGTQTLTILPGMPTATGPSPVDFFFADDNTLYVADDRTNSNGGLQKWVQSAGTWSLAYTKNIVTTNAGYQNGLRGLTGGMVGTDGTVTLFGTSTFGTAGGTNFLVGISDTLGNTSAANVTVNMLANSGSIPTAGGSIANFRGLEAIGIVIPEPCSLGLLAVGSILFSGARRRRA